MLASAKINLFLHVVSKVGSYHSLESLVVFAKNIGDIVEYIQGENYELILEGPFAYQLEESKENSIIKAARFFTNKYKIKTTGIFRLVKNLPVASGIGGGTADAGAILRILSQIHNITINPTDLIDIGADVPACYVTKPLYFQNIGEKISPIYLNFSVPIVLVNPMITSITSEIFKKYSGNFSPTINLVHNFNNLSELVDFLKPLNNDLQKFVNIIHDVLTVLASYNPLIYRMSGSGATCFAIFDSVNKANIVAHDILNNHKDWWVVSDEC